jgi:hypothetical protein
LLHIVVRSPPELYQVLTIKIGTKIPPILPGAGGGGEIVAFLKDAQYIWFLTRAPEEKLFTRA